jgi:hypothetical protein
MLDVVGEPVHLLVVGEQVLAKPAGADEPALPRILDQRILVGPPAEGIVVDILLLMDEQPAGPEIAGDVAVAVLDEPPRAHREGVGKGAVGGHGIEELRPLAGSEPGLLAHEHAVIHLAEGRGDVDHAGSGVGGHEVGRHHPPGGGLGAAGGQPRRARRAGRAVDVEGRQVGAAHERPARESLDNLELFLELLAERGCQGLGHDVFPLVGRLALRGLLPQHHIREVGLYRRELVRGQRPGRRGPGDEAAAGR